MTSVIKSMYWLCRSWGRRGTAAYLTDWVRGMVRMYTESATLNRSDTLNAVTGRSASITGDDGAGETSGSQGDAASCRRPPRHVVHGDRGGSAGDGVQR